MCKASINRKNVTAAVRRAYDEGQPITGTDLQRCAKMIRTIMSQKPEHDQPIMETLSKLLADHTLAFEDAELRVTSLLERDLLREGAERRQRREEKTENWTMRVHSARRQSPRRQKVLVTA